MIKLQRIKDHKQISLAGINVEVEVRDTTVEAITLADADGGYLKIAAGRYNGIDVFAVAPKKKVEKWELTAKFEFLPDVCEVFEHKHEAEDRLREINRNLRDDVVSEIKQVEVDEEEGAI